MKQVNHEVLYLTRSRTEDQLQNRIEERIRGRIWDRTEDQLYLEVEDRVRTTTGYRIWDQASKWWLEARRRGA